MSDLHSERRVLNNPRSSSPQKRGYNNSQDSKINPSKDAINKITPSSK